MFTHSHSIAANVTQKRPGSCLETRDKWLSLAVDGLFAICYRPSVCCLSVVCLSSVTLVHPTQAVQIFGNISTAFGTLAIR